MSFVPQPCCPDNPLQPSGSCGCFAEAEVGRIPASVSTITIVAANPARRGLILWNDSTSTALMKLGTGASSTEFTWKLGPQAGYELPTPIYQGEITALWEAANGAIQVTELV